MEPPGRRGFGRPEGHVFCRIPAKDVTLLTRL